MTTEKLAEGKTKIVWEDEDDPTKVLIESKDDITAGDGVERDIIRGQGVLAQMTTVQVFQLLDQRMAGCTHFLQSVNATMFLAERLRMIPVECVARRRATGSFLKRNPKVEKGAWINPVVAEFYLKDDARHDPLMVWNEFEGQFSLYSPAQPIHEITLGIVRPERLTEWRINATQTNGYPLDPIFAQMQRVTRQVFLVLEEAWDALDVDLWDLKIEFGFAPDGALVVGDVIDNDSWRIFRRSDDRQLDKQRYRDLKKRLREQENGRSPTADELAEIYADYALVAELTDRFADSALVAELTDRFLDNR